MKENILQNLQISLEWQPEPLLYVEEHLDQVENQD